MSLAVSSMRPGQGEVAVPELNRQQFETLRGWHGSDEGTARRPSEMYVAPGREHAEDYAEHGLYSVTYRARNPLHVRDAATFEKHWDGSQAERAPGPFHPAATRAFAAHVRAQGHDAVVLHPEAFEDPHASDTQWEKLAGSFGDPQTILLDPARAKMRRVR